MSSVAQSGKLKRESANTLELRTSKREYREGEGTVKGMKKYYSVDHGAFHAPFCGETCLDPKKFNIYHFRFFSLFYSFGIMFFYDKFLPYFSS